jgi:pimeloyl-ACP methyl ester carboxylesterase
VLAHVSGSDQSAWFSFATRLSERGYRVVTFNFRGYGESQGSRQTALFGRDVEAAVDYLKGESSKRIAIVGADVGGTAALVAAKAPTVNGVIAVSAPAQLSGMDGVAAVKLLTAPKLFIAAHDRKGDVQAAEELYRNAADPREIKILAGGGYGTDLLRGSSGKETAEVIEDFLERVFR